MGRWAFGLAVVCLGVLGGCAPLLGGPQQNPPFAVKVNEQKVTPDSALDAVPADAARYRSITVFDANGRRVTLDAANAPVLFVAYWCPHCQRTLQLLSQNRSELRRLPVMVSMGFVPGTPLSEAVRLTQQEETALHLSGFKTYYALDPSSRQWIPRGYPTLVFDRNGALQMLYGEHTLDVWQKVLGG
jgi:thiol-disulfide isomerase/thioredoxin